MLRYVMLMCFNYFHDKIFVPMILCWKFLQEFFLVKTLVLFMNNFSIFVCHYRTPSLELLIFLLKTAVE
jgi:hypothetical protein